MFKLFDKILMWWNRRYFCKEDLKKGKCSSDLKRECCMYQYICKLGYEQNKYFKR